MKKNEPIYKILREAEWNGFKSNGFSDGSGDDVRDKFIHLCTFDQIPKIVKKYFLNHHPLYIAKFTKKVFLKKLTWEQSSSGESFPHLYHSQLKFEDVESFELV